MIRIIVVATALSTSPVAGLAADRSNFHPGPVFAGFGPVASVESDEKIKSNAVFKVAFDVSEAAKPGELSRSIETAARFINMHVAAGVPARNIQVAIVVHGPASFDLVNNAAYGRHNAGKTNGNAGPIAALIANGVQVHQCGQSAVSQNIAKTDLLPGVKMSLSAMTSHALLQQAGYTLNPF